MEVGKHDSIQSIRTTIRIVKNLKNPKKRKITLYEVFDIIKEPDEYINFQECKEGFTPLFAGRNSYNSYGLKAKVMKEI